MFVCNEAGPAHAVDSVTALGMPRCRLPGESLRHEQVFHGDVVAAAAFKPCDMPVVVYVAIFDGIHERYAGLFSVFPGRDACARGHPFGMANATCEGPSATEDVAVIDRDCLAGEGGGCCCRGNSPTVEDLGDGLIADECAGPSNGGRADHQTPACGGVYVGEFFDDLNLGYGVGFRAAKCLREL